MVISLLNHLKHLYDNLLSLRALRLRAKIFFQLYARYGIDDSLWFPLFGFDANIFKVFHALHNSRKVPRLCMREEQGRHIMVHEGLIVRQLEIGHH